MNCLSDYDVKVLLAFGESLKKNKKFFQWLMENGFPELGALSAAINSDSEALKWLLKSKFPEFGVLSNAIDGEENAFLWLKKHNCDFLLRFALACRKDDKAIKWFVANDLKLFIQFIQMIHVILQQQIDDSADVHRRRIT